MRIKLFRYRAQWLCPRRKSGGLAVICLGLIGLGMGFSYPLAAIPKFVVNSDHWGEQSQIFLANCPEGCLKEGVRGFKPKTHWTSDSQIVDLAWVGPGSKHCAKTDGACLAFKDKTKTRQSVIYGLAVTENHPGILYQFDNTTGEELGSHLLPVCSEGFLLTEDIYFENAWHTFLICAVNSSNPTDSIELPTRLFIWDITDPKVRFTKPICLDSLTALTDRDFKMMTRPCVLRFPSGEYGVSLAGRSLESAGLTIIPLEHLRQTLFVKTGSAALTVVQAMDNGQGVVDTLYTVDEQGILWSIGLTDGKGETPIKVIKVIKVLEGIDPKHAIKVVKAIQHPGTSLYYFGHPAKETGFFKLSADSTGKELKNERIASGRFINLWVRWGCLILAAESSSTMPSVFSRSSQGEQPLAVSWKTVRSATDNGRIVQANLLWDPQQQLETLIILNDKGQITVLQAAITQRHYGRVAWRRTKENT